MRLWARFFRGIKGVRSSIKDKTRERERNYARDKWRDDRRDICMTSGFDNQREITREIAGVFCKFIKKKNIEVKSLFVEKVHDEESLV